MTLHEPFRTLLLSNSATATKTERKGSQCLKLKNGPPWTRFELLQPEWTVFEPRNFATVQYVIRIRFALIQAGQTISEREGTPAIPSGGMLQPETKERERQLMRGNTLQAEADAMEQIIRALVIELMDCGGTTPEATCEVAAERSSRALCCVGGADRVLALCWEIHESSDPWKSASLQELFATFNAKYFSGLLGEFTVLPAVYDAGDYRASRFQAGSIF